MTAHITRHPLIRGGRPVLAGTRIDTSTIREFWEDGYDVPEIIEQFPHLSTAQIMAAIAYERTRRRRLERWTARRLQGVARLSERLAVWGERWA